MLILCVGDDKGDNQSYDKACLLNYTFHEWKDIIITVALYAPKDNVSSQFNAWLAKNKEKWYNLIWISNLFFDHIGCGCSVWLFLQKLSKWLIALWGLKLFVQGLNGVFFRGCQKVAPNTIIFS